jgi:NAD(P)-dependent dehydrogenase (short-subunit alcohol dehydrogenase family)
MTVLITGAGRGIGRAIALALASKGHTMILTARTMTELESVKQEIESKNGKAFIYSCDLTSRDAITSLLASIKNEVGDVDILVNNAGIAESAKLEDTTDEFWQKTFTINVDAPFFLSRGIVPDMKKIGKGIIINIASSAALEGFNYTSAYTASKHALLGLSRALAVELRKSNISVHTICPGFVRTDILTKSVENITKRTGKSSADAETELGKMNASGKIIEPEEVANIVLDIISGTNKKELITL